MTDRKIFLKQAWELYFKELLKYNHRDMLDKEFLFQIFKNGCLLGLNTSRKFHERVIKDIKKTKLGGNHD
jgi:hypothetical protein